MTEFHKVNFATPRPFTVWLTGLSGAGKTTIANALKEAFLLEGNSTYVIDGDLLRGGLCKGLKFDIEDRNENIRRAAEVAAILNDAGVTCVVALISPFVSDRVMAKEIIGADKFAEVYISTPLSVCEARDTKGLYSRARRNEIDNFTGISSPYEPPVNSLVSVDTSTQKLSEIIEVIIAALKK